MGVFVFFLLVMAVVIGSALAALRWRRAPFVGAGALVLGYLVLLAGSGIWAARCPDCPTGDGDRSYYWTVWAIINALLLAFGLLVCLAGGFIVAWRQRGSRR